MFKQKSFSFQLMINFMISTFIPFLLITSILTHLYSKEYDKDNSILLDSVIQSMTSNIYTYLAELEHITMLPYYNNEVFYYLKGLSDGSSYDILEKIRLQRNLESVMSFSRYTREDVEGLFIVDEQKCLYYSVGYTDRRSLTEEYDYGNTDWYQKAIDADGRCVIIGPHSPDYIAPYDTVISLVRSIVDVNNRESMYVIKIDVNTSLFSRLFEDFSVHVNSKVILRDENQEIIYHNKDLITADKEALSQDLSSENRVLLSDGNFRLYTCQIEDYPWNITILLSEHELQQRISIIYLLAISLYLIGIIMAAYSYSRSSRKMVTAISEIKKIMCAIQEEDFSKTYVYHSGTELDLLGEAANNMAIQLDKRIQQEYVMTIRQKNIEFRALQSQIQPHFLFNTLNSFIALNQLGKREALENALFELSEMLRYILKAPALITLCEELSFVSNYCSLQKLRFNERLLYQIKVDSDVPNIKIPKLLIQPIVENSIRHGIEPCNRECSIHIHVSSCDKGILILIEDNGIGFNMEETTGEGIGVKNVQDRLLNYSEKNSFYMESKPGKGTKTTILIGEALNENSYCR